MSTTAVAVPSATIAYKYYINRQKFPIQFNKLYTSNDVVKFVRRFSKNCSTEDISENITNLIISHAHNIDESSIKRLSNLFQIYKDDTGIQGYAISMLWSCTVSATQNHVLSFSD